MGGRRIVLGRGLPPLKAVSCRMLKPPFWSHHAMPKRADRPVQPDITRRTAMATVSTTMSALATGFALAVRPVSAETITTDTDGLLADEVKIPTPDGEIPAYRAAPNQGGPFRVILVVQEIFGVHEHIKDICRRFAKLGYLAIAPELYARQGDVSQITDFKEIISKVVSKVPDKQVLADLDAAVSGLTSGPGARS